MRELNRYHDRCDRCGAQAFVLALLSTGELSFCFHHWKKYKDNIEAVAIEVSDETEYINAEPSVSANAV